MNTFEVPSSILPEKTVPDWFFKDSALYVPERLNEDDRERQAIFKVVALDDEDLIVYEVDGKKYYKMDDISEIDPTECPKACFRALCYAYIFEIGNTMYMRGQNVMLIDERPTKNGKLLLEGMPPPSTKDATDVISEIEGAFSKLMYVDDVTYDEKCTMMERLFGTFSQEGIKLEEDEIGVCCFCKGGCNINSQCCGRCARSWTAYEYESDGESESLNESLIADDPMGLVYE